LWKESSSRLLNVELRRRMEAAPSTIVAWDVAGSGKADNGGAHWHHYLVEDVVTMNLLPPHTCSGEALDLVLLDRMMAILLVSYSLLRASFWNKFWPTGSSRRAKLHLSHRRCQVLAASRNGVSTEHTIMVSSTDLP
jgi:hypothetical protein